MTTQTTPTELPPYGNEIARVHVCAQMGIRFHADPEQIKALAAEIATLSAREDGRSVQTITMHRGDECTVRRSGGYDEHRVVWNTKAPTAGEGK